MTLAIEGVAFVFDGAIETLDREVEEITVLKLNIKFLAGETLLNKVVGYEMLPLVDSVVYRNIEVIVCNEI